MAGFRVIARNAGPGERQHGLQQHVAAGLEIRRFGAFLFVMAESAGAGHENHRGRRDPAHLAGIVAGAGHHFAVAVVQVLRGRFDRGDAARIEHDRRVMPDFVDFTGNPVVRQAGGARAKLRVHPIQQLAVGMAQIHGQENFTGNRVARIGHDRHFADRADAVGGVFQRQFLHQGDDTCARHQRVAASRHRRRAGMRILSANGQIVPAHALAADHDPDLPAFRLEDRALFDMRLEQRADRVFAAVYIAEITDAAQFVADGVAVGVGPRPGVFLVEQAGVNARCNHRRRETRSFLVGPDHGFERRLGGDFVIVQGSQRFQCGQHAVNPVEPAAVRLGVEMAAGDDRRQVVIAPGAAGKDIAHVVDLDAAADFLAPANE